ncbi:ParB/RepB/Spo0J family partition protein [Luteimonas soli]|uniref:ParB/RepB/Spo0J family partition protein n=1 Tax=Luteimonas soli TaxID=1648966 RepID=A0ABV7XIR5_9GAMM
MQTVTTTATAPTLIPLNQLHRSDLNVRKTGGTDVAELAANIRASQRVIQNLVVVPEKRGKKEGYGVVAGGRRLAALASLAKDKAIPTDWPIPCQIVTREEAVELSMAENIHREDMHPADEFDAWAKLVDAGTDVEEIAARHGTSPEVVRRRLALSRVSPKVMKLYRSGDLRLEQVMAFTLTSDHRAQDALLKGRSYYPSAHEIRRALTSEAVPETDERARYVGEKAYVAAGGTVTRDMFDERNGAYFNDAALLTRLAAEKLEKVAEKLRRDAPWVDVYAEELDYQIRGNYADIPTVRQEPNAATAKKLAALQAKLDKATDELRILEDMPPSNDEDADDEAAWMAASEKVDAIEAEISAIEDTLRVPHPEGAQLAGVVVGLSSDGKVKKLLNVIRAADKAKLRKASAGTSASSEAGQEAGDADKDDPQSVRTDLSTYLTAVTQEALAENVPIALRALAYQLALRWIGESYNNHGVTISAEDHANLPVSATLEGSAVEQQGKRRHEAWQDTLPRDAEALWQWCLAADDNTILSLLAYSTARSLAGTQFHAGAQKMAPLVAALGVKLTDHWQPQAGYFARIKKATTLRVLAENGHADPALSKMKRGLLSEKAADLLAGSGWLPPTLTL